MPTLRPIRSTRTRGRRAAAAWAIAARVVARAVVDDDQLELGDRLGEDRVDRPARSVAGAVVGADQDGHARRHGRPRRSPRTASSELRSDSAAALRANQRAVDSRSAGPAVADAQDRRREVLGDGRAATMPFTPSATSSAAALSGSSTTTLGVPARRRLDDHHAVALAARRAAPCTGPARAPRRAPRRRRSRARRPRRRARAAPPGLDRGALRPVAEHLAAQVRARARAARAIAGHERGHALLRDVAAGEHDQRLAGSGAAPLERAGVLALEHGHVAAQALLAQPRARAAARSRTRAGGTRSAQRAAPPSRRAARAGRGTRASSRASTLVPVHDERVAPRAAGTPRRRAARSTGTTAVWTTS